MLGDDVTFFTFLPKTSELLNYVTVEIYIIIIIIIIITHIIIIIIINNNNNIVIW